MHRQAPDLHADPEWRPRSAHSVPLTDAELAKLGLLAQLEAQCRANLAMALKSLDGLDTDGWKKLEVLQFGQLVQRLSQGADAVDVDLAELVARIAAVHADVLALRHQNLHSLWAFSEEHPEGVMAWDLKRDRKLVTPDLDADLQRVSDLTHACLACATRVAQLIVDGVLPEGSGPNGPYLRVEGRWVKF